MLLLIPFCSKFSFFLLKLLDIAVLNSKHPLLPAFYLQHFFLITITVHLNLLPIDAASILPWPKTSIQLPLEAKPPSPFLGDSGRIDGSIRFQEWPKNLKKMHITYFSYTMLLQMVEIRRDTEIVWFITKFFSNIKIGNLKWQKIYHDK